MRRSRTGPTGRRAMSIPLAAVAMLAVAVAVAACGGAPASAGPVTLRLQVALTPPEMASFQPAIQALDDAHPEWVIQLEPIPQGSETERITTELAGGGLPDVLRIQGSLVQEWIRRSAFLDLTQRIADAHLDLADFYAGPLDQFRWQDKVWGLSDTASPEIVFYDKKVLADAGVEPPTDQWTVDDMRTAAIRLTVDNSGRHPGDAGFDPAHIERWGWNGGVTYYWQNAWIQDRGGELCANPDCTTMSFTDPADVAAFQWWVDLIQKDHATLYDPYGGSQTGVPGDPFISGKSAMGSNGTFAIGQLDAAGTIDYGMAAPLRGSDGVRRTPLSSSGYVVAATSTHPDQAWALVQALLDPTFLTKTWGEPGHAVPARRSASGSIPEKGRDAILAAMEVGQVFRPYTAGAGAAYSQTIDLFTQMNTGTLPIPEALAQIEAAANAALAADRTP